MRTHPLRGRASGETAGHQILIYKRSGRTTLTAGPADAANRIGQAEFNSHAAITAASPDVRYVRAFNTLGWENFAKPPQGAVLFFAADSSARSTAEELIWAIGLEPAYVGDARACGTVDALLPLWFALVTHQGGDRRLAFSIVR